MCLPQAGAEDLVECVPFPLDGRAATRPFPFEPFPLLEAVPACVPLRLPFVPAGALGLQREAEAGRAPLAVREPMGRDSAPVRRTGRLLEFDCAGLRSRGLAAGRLKWGRAAADFPLAAGLRAATVRGA